MGVISETGDRVSSSTAGAAEERDTRSENNRIRGQAGIMDSREEMGMITEEMGIYPTPHTPKTYRGTGRTGEELIWCDR